MSIAAGERRKSVWRDVVLLAVPLLGLFLFLLGHRPLATPDEGRYVEIPREMLASGDLITPHLNGLPYFEKPPLFYWMEAGLIALFGLENTFALRLSTAFFGVLGCFLVFGFAYRPLGRQVALWSGGVLATSVLYFLLARLLILDLLFAVFMTAALCSFWQSTQPPRAGRWSGLWSWLWPLLYGASLAGGVMSKGLIGVVLPGLVILIWIAWTRQWSLLKVAFHPLALLMFAGLVLPWHLAVSFKNPEFPFFYFIQEHVLRYTTTMHRRHQPFWFFGPVLLLGFFPWVSFLPVCVKAYRERLLVMPQQLFSFLLLWAGVVFCFFSFSSSKLIPYLIPAFPPLALLVGTLIVQAPDRGAKAFGLYGFFGVLVGLGVLLYIPFDCFFLNATHDVWFFAPPVLLATCVLWAGIVACFWVRKRNPRRGFQAILITMGVFLMTLAYLDPALQPRPSIQPLAKKLRPLLGPDTPVIACACYPQDLPVYLERTVHVFAHASELDFGASIRPHQDRLLKDEAFEALWSGASRAFAILPCRGRAVMGEDSMYWYTYMQDRFPHLSFYVICVHPSYLLCSNVPSEKPLP